jgi:hypothetical protein
VGERMAAEIDIVVGEKTATGVAGFQTQSVTVLLPSGPQRPAADGYLPYPIGFQVGADTTAIRVVVRDRLTGRLGTLDLEAKHLSAGRPASAR